MKTFDKRLSEIELKQDDTNAKLDTLDASVQALQPPSYAPISETATADTVKSYTVPSTKIFRPKRIVGKNFAAGVIPGTLPTNAKFLYHFDNNLVDSSGNPYSADMTLSGAAVFTAGDTGFGQSYANTLSSLTLTPAARAALVLQSNMWLELKMFVPSPFGDSRNVIRKGSSATSVDWQLEWSGGILRFGRFGTQHFGLTSGFVFGAWNYLVFSITGGTGGTARIYCNGVLRDTYTGISSGIEGSDTEGSFQVQDPSGGGYIDEVVLVNGSAYVLGATPTIPYTIPSSNPRPTKIMVEVGVGANLTKIFEQAISATDTKKVFTNEIVESSTSDDGFESYIPMKDVELVATEVIKVSTDSGSTDFAIEGNLS